MDEVVSPTILDVMAELAKVRETIETVARLSCPVCAPKVIAEIHPDAVKVIAEPVAHNGRHR